METHWWVLLTTHIFRSKSQGHWELKYQKVQRPKSESTYTEGLHSFYLDASWYIVINVIFRFGNSVITQVVVKLRVLSIRNFNPPQETEMAKIVATSSLKANLVG
jgi:hypothetical protein